MNTSIATLLERKGSAVFAVPPTITASAAVQEMNRRKVGSVLIMEGERLLGIFTERDVLSRVVAADLDPKVHSVAEVMTANVLTVTPKATVEEVMALFDQHHCRHLPVVDGARVVGLISIGDISRWVADVSRHEAEQLKQYIAGGFPT